MARKVGKRTREEAALICAVLASQETWRSFTCDVPIGPLESPARRLADAAWEAALGPGRTWRDIYAEAEALLRTGWSP